jgi:transcriptional regulator with XRE-family HTH domain
MTMSMSHQRYASIAGSAFRTLNSTQEELTRPEKFSKNANPIARRLALTRELLGLAEKEFAEWAGVALSRYHLWETGRVPISLSSAIALCAAHGLTLDWLYRGKILGLPLWLAIEIEACSATLAAKSFTIKANHQGMDGTG